jgi:hypothetical protein
MKKLVPYTLLTLMLVFGTQTHAQMMGMQKVATNTASTETQREEAEGKAIWDKLQNKEVVCKDLKDDDFDVLADFFMANMMGTNHEAMNTMMAQRLGEDGEKQMHIAMGKRLSGCDTSAELPKGSDYFTPMMGGHTGMGGMMGDEKKWRESRGGYHQGMMSHGGFGFFHVVFPILGFVFLVLGSIFFWKGIKRKE